VTRARAALRAIRTTSPVVSGCGARSSPAAERRPVQGAACAASTLQPSAEATQSSTLSYTTGKSW
jgi:hypothetical protein